MCGLKQVINLSEFQFSFVNEDINTFLAELTEFLLGLDGEKGFTDLKMLNTCPNSFDFLTKEKNGFCSFSIVYFFRVCLEHSRC